MVCYGCCKKGDVSIKGTFEKSFYSNGDTVRINAEIENKSNSNVYVSGKCFFKVSLTDGFRVDNNDMIVGQSANAVIVLAGSPIETIPLIFVLNCGDNMPTCVGGTLITAEYNLVISVKYDTIACDCCMTNPMLKAPIMVCPKVQEYLPLPFEVPN